MPMPNHKDKELLINNSKDRLQNSLNKSEVLNSLGYKVDINTLTAIKAKVTSQRFYEVAPSDYMPIVVGENAFSEDLLTYKDYSTGSNFEDGIIQGGSNAGRMFTASVALEAVKVPVVDWGIQIDYNLIELGKASKSGNWSLIEAKEKSRYKQWQLGIQRAAFLGLDANSDVKGLLTQGDVASNTTTIPKFIKDMSVTEYKTLVENILGQYYENTDNTTMPTHFVIPTIDFLGLGASVSDQYWNHTKLNWLLNTFKELTMNPNFKILPLAYAQKEKNSSVLNPGTGINRYSLYNFNDESLRMDIPIDYTTTITDTINGFSYHSVGYGEFTGAKAYREKEMLYFDHSL